MAWQVVSVPRRVASGTQQGVIILGRHSARVTPQRAPDVVETDGCFHVFLFGVQRLRAMTEWSPEPLAHLVSGKNGCPTPCWRTVVGMVTPCWHTLLTTFTSGAARCRGTRLRAPVPTVPPLKHVSYDCPACQKNGPTGPKSSQPRAAQPQPKE